MSNNSKDLGAPRQSISIENQGVQTADYLRGRTILASQDLSAEIDVLREDHYDPGLLLSTLLLPSSDSPKHFLFLGSPGSGKTVLIRLLMQSAFQKIGHKWKSQFPESEFLNYENTLERHHESQRQAEQAKEDHRIKVAQVQAENALMASQYQDNLTLYDQQCSENESKLAGKQLLGCAGLTVILPIVGAAAMIIFGLLYVATDSSVLMGLGVVAAIAAIICVWVFVERRIDGSNQQASMLTKPSEPTYKEEPSPPVHVSVPAPIRYEGPVRWDAHRALIYDAKLEVIPQLYGMHVAADIFILNPFDKRSVAWDMASDITDPATARQVAAILIPEEKNASQPFFSDAARHLLDGVLQALILNAPQAWSFRDVLLSTKRLSDLKSLLNSRTETAHLVETYLQSDRETQSIISTLATKLGHFDVVAALWDCAERKVSLREWLETESILVLGSDEAHRAILDPLNRLMFKRVVELLLAKPGTQTGKTWFFLDEVREAGHLDGLARLMTKGRFVGASVVLGLQDIEGFREAFGEKVANEIAGLCGFKTILRLDSPESAKWAESVFGEYEAVELKRSHAEGTSESQGTNESTAKSSNTSQGSTSGENVSSGFSGGWGNNSQGRSSSTSYTSGSSDSRTSGTNESRSQSRNETISAELSKRTAILSSEFLSLPPTNVRNGVSGMLATPYGAARFRLEGFHELLASEMDGVYGIDYRESRAQYLKPWTIDERERVIGTIEGAKSMSLTEIIERRSKRRTQTK